MRTSKSNGKSPQESPIDFRTLFQDLPESYLLVKADDPTFTIIDLNKARERLAEVPRAKAVGRPLFEVYPNLNNSEGKVTGNRVHQSFKKLLKTGKPQTLEKLRYPLGDGSGGARERYWLSTYYPVRSEQDIITHILCCTKDITEQRLERTRTEEAEKRLESALAIGKVGSWLWDLESDGMIADPYMAKLFGVNRRDAKKGLPLKTFQGMVHPDDRERVMEAVNHSIRHKGKFEAEYRITHKGKIRWVLARGKVEERDGKLFFPGVIVDITERRDLQAQVELARQQDKLNQRAAKILQERNEELEAISRTKDEFVALASHQLRTPATAVKQYLGMVLQGYVGDITKMQAEMLGKAFESNERQIEIINQILNAARVDTGRLLMTQVPADLRNLVQGIIVDMESSVRQRKQDLRVSMPKRPVPVMADLGYLRMAIENIVHNASIYTPDGGSISIKLARLANRCELSVTDTGVGIRKADLSKLFIKFSRIHNPLSVQAGGSGIGLYLAGEIIRLHRGNVSVSSKIGRGSTFAISLPLVHNESYSEAKVIRRSRTQTSHA